MESAEVVGVRKNVAGEASQTAAAAEHAAALIEEARAELVRADGKATALLAGVLAFAGLVLGNGRWSPLQLSPAARALWVLAGVAATAGAVLLCATVYPATGDREAKDVLGYHRHVSAHGSAEELERALLLRAAESPLGRRAHKLLALSELVERKYRRTRLAMWSLAGAAALAGAGLLLGATGR